MGAERQRLDAPGIGMELRPLGTDQGALVSRRLGNLRLSSFNEANPTVRNLRKMLEEELAALKEDDQPQFFRQRQRPRQGDKPPMVASS